MMIKSSKLARHATIHQPGVLPNASQEPKVLGQNIESRVLSTCTDTGEKSDKTLSFAPSDLFCQGNEIEKDVHPRGEKGDGNHSSAQAAHMMKTKNIGLKQQRNIMML